MMNHINQIQNDDEAIKLLYCQRLTYDRAKAIGIVIFAITIISTVIIILPSFVDSIDKKSIATTNIFISLLNAFLFFLKNKEQEEGADFQEQFDCHVFGFKQSSYERLKGSIDIDKVNTVHRSKKICAINKKHLASQQLTNWYSDVSEFTNTPSAILMCQLENVCWSYKLKRTYILFSISLLIVLLIVTFSLYSSKTIDYVLNVIISIPLIMYILIWGKKSVSDYFNFSKLKDNSERLFRELEHSGKITSEDNMALQNDIFIYRKTSLIVPNFFYWLYRKAYQIESTQTTKNRIDKLKEKQPKLFK